jgi:hypothetical protein
MSGDVLGRLAERICDVWGRGLPNWDGSFVEFGPFTPGLRGVPRPVPRDAMVSVHAVGVHGDEFRFAKRRSGAWVHAHGVAANVLAPFVQAVEQELDGPSCAVAVRDEGDIWAVAANRGEVVDLAGVDSDEVEVSRVGVVVTTRVDGRDSDVRYPALEPLLAGDETAIAHRFVGDAWVVGLFPV